jgi:hypothetical protein
LDLGQWEVDIEMDSGTNCFILRLVNSDVQQKFGCFYEEGSGGIHVMWIGRGRFNEIECIYLGI